jgi:HD-GYP domain-containing protein (c-di-GMP phosphodiesterase class II)
MAESPSARIMLVALEPEVAALVEATCEGCHFDRIDSSADFVGQYEKWTDDSYHAFICGSKIADFSANEMAQVLLNQCPGTLKYFITSDASKYEPRLLVKNGFTSAYAYPMDAPLIKQSLRENILSRVGQRSFRTVRVLDLSAGDELDFETYIYLPLNNKYIRYTAANTAVDAKKLEKLQDHEMARLWVDHRDMNKFYQYSAMKLRALGESGLSSTERQEKLKDNVRMLFSDIFDQSVKADFDQGKEMIKQCESIISNYVTKGASSNWFQKLMNAIGEGGDTYNHASNVATFAALFGIGIGHPAPEDLAMAGLFHDLGMNQLPLEVQEKTLEQMTPEEQALYIAHPEKSLNMVKMKRIVIPERVEKAIMQHHEMWSGKGFPKQLPSVRISQDAQILSFADQFDYLTREREGAVRVTPLEALEKIRKTGSINPDLLSQIRRLLLKDKEAAAAKTV